jgi:hypothetical protein
LTRPTFPHIAHPFLSGLSVPTLWFLAGLGAMSPWRFLNNVELFDVPDSVSNRGKKE